MQPQEKRAAARRQAIASMVSGAVAQPISGLAGLAGLLMGGAKKGAEYVDATQKALTYQPRDPSALNTLSRWVAPVTTKIESAKQGLGDRNFEATGSAGWATAAQVAPDLLLTALGARFGGGVKGTPLSEMVARSAGPGMGSKAAQRGAIGAWHGSPHDFDRFDMSKLGTGEGAQAYGHGLYFADSPDVARQYAGSLSAARATQPVGNVDLTQLYQSMPNDVPDSLLAARRDYRELQGMGELSAADRRDYLQAVQNNIVGGKGGRMYEVELAPDETDLLDWDAPLTQQPEKVRAALEAAGHDLSSFGESSGKDFYQWLVGGKANNPANRSDKASRTLRQIGIPGIRYLDGGSRASGDGSRNYVIFDDQLVRIKSKE